MLGAAAGSVRFVIAEILLIALECKDLYRNQVGDLSSLAQDTGGAGAFVF
jgi:hypothetical protein